ncbi:MAG: hypothetical protein JXA22_06700 [Candidatus Thermoplasmatota archaeon]|nr:hypothetical protein [Candidatus Thermoplasmatota archaeon]
MIRVGVRSKVHIIAAIFLIIGIIAGILGGVIIDEVIEEEKEEGPGEYKYYAPGIGSVHECSTDDSETIWLINIQMV